MCVYGIFLYFCSVFINKLLRYWWISNYDRRFLCFLSCQYWHKQWFQTSDSVGSIRATDCRTHRWIASCAIQEASSGCQHLLDSAVTTVTVSAHSILMKVTQQQSVLTVLQRWWKPLTADCGSITALTMQYMTPSQRLWNDGLQNLWQNTE